MHNQQNAGMEVYLLKNAVVILGAQKDISLALEVGYVCGQTRLYTLKLYLTIVLSGKSHDLNWLVLC